MGLLAHTDFMEKAGTGIKRVRDACRINGNEANFHFTDAFWITIHSNVKDTKNVPDNVPDNVPNNRQMIILQLIQNNKQILLKELAEMLKVSTRTIRRDIEKLKQMNKLKRIGPAKGGHWVISTNP